MSYLRFTCENWFFTHLCVASTSRRIHANCRQSHLNLLDNSGYFTGSFTCRNYAFLPPTGKQKCFQQRAKTSNRWQKSRNCKRLHTLLQTIAHAIACKKTYNRRQKHPQLQAEEPVVAIKDTINCRQKYPHLNAICSHIAGWIHLQIASKSACILHVKITPTCVFYYVRSRVFCVRCLPSRSR